MQSLKESGDHKGYSLELHKDRKRLRQSLYEVLAAKIKLDENIAQINQHIKFQLGRKNRSNMRSDILVEELCHLEFQLFDSHPNGKRMVEKDGTNMYWSKKVFGDKYQKTNSFLCFAPAKLCACSDTLMDKMNRFKVKKAVFDEAVAGSSAKKRVRATKKKSSLALKK